MVGVVLVVLVLMLVLVVVVDIDFVDDDDIRVGADVADVVVDGGVAVVVHCLRKRVSSCAAAEYDVVSVRGVWFGFVVSDVAVVVGSSLVARKVVVVDVGLWVGMNSACSDKMYSEPWVVAVVALHRKKTKKITHTQKKITQNTQNTQTYTHTQEHTTCALCAKMKMGW